MQPPLTQLGVLSPVELVKKNATSPSAHRKRARQAQRKIMIVFQEQSRIAKAHGMRAVALTLTYRDNDQFAKKHITRFLDCLRSKLKRMGHTLVYVWVLERATALHYHLILWLPRGFTLTYKSLEAWWPWGSTWVKACRNARAWGRYMSKTKDKAGLPPKARLFGYGGLDLEGKRQVFVVSLPYWLKPVLQSGIMVKRAFGAWTDMLTGEMFPCPWTWTGRGFVPRS